jgi:hypothetical protein
MRRREAQGMTFDVFGALRPVGEDGEVAPVKQS